MTKTEKKKQVESLTQTIKETEVLYVADLAGLSANVNNNFRRLCFQNDVKLKVVKNSLLRRAMDASGKDFAELKEALKGSSALLYSEQANKPARLIQSFRKKSNLPFLKGAYINQSVYIGDDQLKSLVGLKSKEELLGEIVGLLQSPVKSVVSALQGGTQSVLGALETLSKKE